MKKQTWKMINVGRNKTNRTVSVRTDLELLAEVEKELMSSDVYIEFEDESLAFVYAGMYQVGRLERLNLKVVS